MISSGLILSRARLRITRGGGTAERRSTAPYLTHQAVADLFGDREDRGYLYRTTGEWPGGAEVLVLSRANPLPTSEIASPDHRRAMRVESKAFQPQLSIGQMLDCEIRLNATQVVTESNGHKRRTDAWEAVWKADKQSPRTPHEVYGEYLARKLEGVAALQPQDDNYTPSLARITERGEVQARRGDHPKAIRFVAVNLITTLRVEDPERLLEIVGNGIGRAKAFGCGLLCLSHPGTILARRYPALADELL